MNRMLETDIDFFSAAIAQATVEMWQEYSAGVYCYVDSGVVEKFTPISVKIRNTNGDADYYFRDVTMFQTRNTPTDVWRRQWA